MSSSDSALAHHFDSYDQQRESASLGMWLFVGQEILFFGGLFGAYLINRMHNYEGFAIASQELDITLGGFNTVVLILSSLTMALAVREAQLERPRRLFGFLVATFLLGVVFLGVKVVEYSHKFHEHLIPGESFQFHVAGMERSAELFFSLYFAMTGLHAIHMIIGMAILLFYLRPALKGRYNRDYHNPIECFGLYWHFVDIVWIFLFPLLYLLGRS